MKVKAVISAALLCAFAISASGCDGADIGTDNHPINYTYYITLIQHKK